MGIGRFPLGPRGNGGGHEGELLPFERANLGFAGHVDPERFGLPVIHDERLLIQNPE